jgi:hypothetical protein
MSSFFLETYSPGTQTQRSPEYDMPSDVKSLGSRSYVIPSKFRDEERMFSSLSNFPLYGFKIMMDIWMLSLFKKHLCDFMYRVYLKIPSMSSFCLGTYASGFKKKKTQYLDD